MKLAALSTHLIQTFSPLYRELAQASAGFRVLYLSSIDESRLGPYDQGFGRQVRWDVDLLGGYDSVCLNIPVKDAIHPDVRTMLRIRQRVLAWLRAESPDVVLLPGWTANYLACYTALRLAKVPYVIRSTARVPVGQSVGRGLISDLVKRRVVQNAGALAYIGSASRDEYLRLGATEDRLFFSPYTIDDDAWRTRLQESSPVRAAVRSSMNVPADSTLFIYVGKLVAFKQVDRLIKAFAVSLEKSDSYLLLVGDGPLKQDLRGLCESLGILGRVRFAGFQNQTQLPRFYAAADAALLFSSPQETWGLVTNEAVLAGLPLGISQDVGASRDLVCNGVTGFRLDTSDIDACAGALVRLSSQECRRVMLPALSRLADQYTVKRAATGLLQAAALAARAQDSTSPN